MIYHHRSRTFPVFSDWVIGCKIIGNITWLWLYFQPPHFTGERTKAQWSQMTNRARIWFKRMTLLFVLFLFDSLKFANYFKLMKKINFTNIMYFLVQKVLLVNWYESSSSSWSLASAHVALERNKGWKLKDFASDPAFWHQFLAPEFLFSFSKAFYLTNPALTRVPGVF